ncbi:MAG: hypothetical protein SNJ29_15900 [Rikenellaceae bacterium]
MEIVKLIVLSSKARQEVAISFEVSRQTVWAALSYKTNSKRAQRIRTAALRRRGVIVDFRLCVIEGCIFDTYWSEVPHQMIQVFHDRIQLVVDIASRRGTIEVDGVEVREFQNVSLQRIAELQGCAREIVNGLKE